MPSKWNRVRDSFQRAHDDLFDSTTYDAEFYTYTAGTYDSGEITGRTRELVGTRTVEIVPPASDATISREGTDLSFSTSIRLSLEPNKGFIQSLDFPGDETNKPGQVEIRDNVDNSTETYELHGYSEERGSGFVMIRLEEL